MNLIMGKKMKKATAFLLTCLSTLKLFGTLRSPAGAVPAATFQDELWLLLGRTDAMVRGNRVPICATRPTASPFATDDETQTFYVPLSALCLYREEWNFAIDGDTVTVTAKGGATCTLTIGSTAWSGGTFLLPPVCKDGEVYLSEQALQAVFSVKTFFNDSIGLIVIGDKAPAYSKDYTSLKEQIHILRYYIFDQVTGDGIYNDIVRHIGVGTHPRLMGTQERFDTVRENYLYYSDPAREKEAASDRLYVMTAQFIAQADEYFNDAFVEQTDTEGKISYRWISQEHIDKLRQPYYLYDEDGNRLVGATEYVNRAGETIRITDVYGVSPLYGDGYDQGGRSNVATHSEQLQYYAFAWQITRNEKYAFAFYSLAHELGKWEHWGEAHFLNCADGSAPFALGLDWIWHAFDSEPEKRDELARVLYEKAVDIAYYCLTDPENKLGHLHRGVIMGGIWQLTEFTNNWNTVCTSGIVMAALTLLSYDEYAEHAKYTMEKQIGALYKCLVQYAPDGAYIESPGYWAYSTNTLMRMLSCLQSSAGTTYGYLDTIGLHQSFYFAHNICDSDYYVWNYHDGARYRFDGTVIYMAAALYGDPTIARFRDLNLQRYPTSFCIYDPMFYSPALSAESSTEAPLDYCFKGIETVTMRSSWEALASYAGLHAGANLVPHGDIDSGTFFLELGKVLWFGDSGSENYNIGNYFDDDYRYFFYRKSAEAHNVVIIHAQEGDTTSDIYKYGQMLNTQSDPYATIDRFFTDENGSYAVANMAPQYGPTCLAAKRGLLFTNSRTTAVIQDDISFSVPTSLTWTSVPRVRSVSVSDDGRTAYLIVFDAYSRPITMRASIVSDDPSLQFSIMTTGTILPRTVTRNDHNGTPENRTYPAASGPDTRLTIHAEGVTEFHCAVVFEMIRLGGSREPTVGYTYTDTDNWKTTTDEWLIEANADIDYARKTLYKYDPSDLMILLGKLDAADREKDPAKICGLLQSMIDLPDNIDQNNTIVKGNIGRFWQYVRATNAYICDLNHQFASLFEAAAGAI